ncbi:hypothetical protein [Streptomyces sp. NPDC055912]|uniref:hypothetical protein n=1 Tax=Streptomyces sp. NPDC055912 TaxID=3345660 RepID=UPI0035D74052
MTTCPTTAPLANGTSTDHPVPGLPFVADTDLRGILSDPHAVSAGPLELSDQHRDDVTWIVRVHPQFGRTVLLYENGSGSGWIDWEDDPPLLTRAGGYAWDGTAWFRPAQLWDDTAGAFERHRVPQAVTVSAADLLRDSGADAALGREYTTVSLSAERPDPANWAHDLARWAAGRSRSPRRPDLGDCVVTLTAPELAGGQLVGTPGFAAIAGISSSTLRAYNSRGLCRVPQPQAVVGGRPLWSRPVAHDWAAQRLRPAPGDHGAGRTRRADTLPAGAEGLRAHLDQLFFAALWRHPGRRSRWVLRHRSPDAVHEVAADLAHLAAIRLHDMVPTQALAALVTDAARADLAAGNGLSEPVEQLLGWLTAHHPDVGRQTAAGIAEQARSSPGGAGRHAEQAPYAALPGDGEKPASCGAERA